MNEIIFYLDLNKQLSKMHTQILITLSTNTFVILKTPTIMQQNCFPCYFIPPVKSVLFYCRCMENTDEIVMSVCMKKARIISFSTKSKIPQQTE